MCGGGGLLAGFGLLCEFFGVLAQFAESFEGGGLFWRVEDAEPLLEFGIVLGVGGLDEAFAGGGEFEAAGSAVFLDGFADDEALGFHAVYGGGHGAGGEEDARLDFRDGERAFVEQGFEQHEVCEAQTGLGYALLYQLADGTVGVGQCDPEVIGGGLAELTSGGHLILPYCAYGGVDEMSLDKDSFDNDNGSDRKANRGGCG
jgi:hypothetical protein